MMKRKAAFLTFLALLLVSAPMARGDVGDLPDKATLSANRMRFDSGTGDFLADGNVVIKAGGLTVEAPYGSGNVERQEVLFDRGITASGAWMGDPVDLKAGRLVLSFAQDPTCRFQNGVRGGVGALRIDADRLTLTRRDRAADPEVKFWVVKARSLEDRSRGITLGADAMEGLLVGGELHTMTAEKGVWVKGRPKAGGDAVSLRGNHALYSRDRGSLVMSGNVSAVQGGRSLKSDSIVYFPDQNRVEAMGGASRQDGTPAGRAEITIDLSREKGLKDTPRQEAPKAKEKAAPRKRR